MNSPFLTVLTPTYRRPKGLAACLESVRTQTAVHEIQQVVMVDHVGIGVHGMFARVPEYAPMVRGKYVTFLCDDDAFYSHTSVAELKQAAQQNDEPPLLIVDTVKGVNRWPAGRIWPPQEGTIDLNCAVVRNDIWQRFVSAYSLNGRYEGDFDHMNAMAQAGIQAVFVDVLLSNGAVSRGAAEAA